MFDFDELDALEERLASEAIPKPEPAASDGSTASSGAPTPAGGGLEIEVDGEVDECLSEVWPDDVPNDLEALDLAEAPENGEEDLDDSAPRPWEVIFSRVVIREQPQLDSRVTGICSRAELVFEEQGSHDPNWVKLVDGRGFILKDGRLKDPKLGMLLRPFAWPPEVRVPKEFRSRVLGALKDGWVRLHSEHTLLGPSEIRRLRQAGEDAARAACKGAKFDFHAYDDHLWGEVMSLVAAAGARHHVPQTPLGMPPQQASGCGGGCGMTLVSASGGPALLGGHPPASGLPGSNFAWNHNAPKLDDEPRGFNIRESPITANYAQRLVQSMRCRSLPCEGDVMWILRQAEEIWLRSTTLAHIQVPAGATLRVIGDLHGQYWDLLHIFEVYGPPSPTNFYLFNGDMVDRGQFSTEVVLAIFAWKVAMPHSVFVNRGNHEAENLNMLFGFQVEVKLKYSEAVFSHFSRAFRALPLASVVNDAVFVVHGGLGASSPLLLSDVGRLARVCEPQDGTLLMTELLWSDPMDFAGSRPSPRGGGVLFGPDLTQRFCEDNDLLCVIRSHEMKAEGFEWAHAGLCLTLFSAANYCGICGNLGAVCSIRPRGGRLSREDLELTTFEAHEPPHEAGMPRGFGIFA